MDIDLLQKEEEEIDEKRDLPVRFEMPYRRFNSQLAVLDDTLFIFSGTFERGDHEFTFNDMYSIDLVKLDGVKELFYNEPEHWNDAMEVESDEEDEEDEEAEEGECGNEDEEMEFVEIASTATATTSVTELVQMETEIEQEIETPVQDSRPHPRPFESLRDFFARTSTDWQDMLMSKMKVEQAGSEMSVKELRKEAFTLAEEKWWDCREEITALEDEQEEAGIGEVVSIADRNDAPSAGRRR
ncbi:hypothetical protein PABG_11396 [Paracoccidioides brasiliensis Pb03]|nr:hypothetical protein PABG_11396 [Paracoccidioides brasiliensis Pb03]